MMILLRKCINCNSWLSIDKFLCREDRPGFYAFCNNCMIEQGRSPDHPKLRERNPGMFELESWRLTQLS